LELTAGVEEEEEEEEVEVEDWENVGGTRVREENRRRRRRRGRGERSIVERWKARGAKGEEEEGLELWLCVPWICDEEWFANCDSVILGGVGFLFLRC
jgi:hypothetical protein